MKLSRNQHPAAGAGQHDEPGHRFVRPGRPDPPARAELPDIDPPIVTVLTVYPGANAEVVETEVTEKLEEAINSIEGIKDC
jgi:hypothetical protein